MGHISQEGTLQSARVLRALSLLTQTLLSLHQMSYVSCQAKISSNHTLSITDGKAMQQIPAWLWVGRYIVKMMNGMEGCPLLNHIHQITVCLFTFLGIHTLNILFATQGKLHLAKRSGEVDFTRCYIKLPHIHVTLLQQVVKALLVTPDIGIGIL